jgi:hypothetical protein
MGLYVVWFNHSTWGGARFVSPLSTGKEAPKAVYLALVEKVRVPRDGRIHVEGEEPLGPELERFRV